MQQRIRNPITAPLLPPNVVDMGTYRCKGTSSPAPVPKPAPKVYDYDETLNEVVRLQMAMTIAVGKLLKTNR